MKPDLTLDLDKDKDQTSQEGNETLIQINGGDIKTQENSNDEHEEHEEPLSSRSQSSRKEKIDLNLRPKTVPTSGRSRYEKLL